MVFSGNLWPAAIRAALAAGALGIVDKMAVLEVFRTAVQTVAAKRAYFSPLVSEQIKQLVSRRTPEGAKPAALSNRERTVLRYIAEGFSSKEIAGFLGISAYTVINHRTNLMRKVGLRRAAQLSLYAAQLGLIGSGVAPMEQRTAKESPV
jgi:DNA-binding NarL/FixJ family response regulator